MKERPEYPRVPDLKHDPPDIPRTNRACQRTPAHEVLASVRRWKDRNGMQKAIPGHVCCLSVGILCIGGRGCRKP